MCCKEGWMADNRKLLKRFGERGRNRTFNLLIKSKVSATGCRRVNRSHNNNLTAKAPARTG
jgi:hypothetical protein